MRNDENLMSDCWADYCRRSSIDSLAAVARLWPFQSEKKRIGTIHTIECE